MSLKSRIGQFLLSIGLIALVVFFATVQGGRPAMLALLIGAACAILGLVLIVSGRQPPEPSGRFRLLRSARDKLADKPEEKQNS